MRFVVGSLLLALSVAGGVSPLEAQDRNAKYRAHKGKALPGEYLVVFHDWVDERSIADVASELVGRHRGARRYLYKRAVKGFSARLAEQDARSLSADPRVAYVEEDAVARSVGTQTGVDWGLDRIDQRTGPLDGTYVYESEGFGVHVYVIDSGIRTTHVEFEGRAFGAYSVVEDALGSNDCNGHGTHVAAVVAGATFGVAKGAFVHSVRVLPCSGVAPWSSVIAGIDWVTANHLKPAVANLSIAGGEVLAARAAIRGAIQAGVTVVGAAGNDIIEACLTTPGGVREALIVGNSNEWDARYHTSNFGVCVDLFAPGTNIRSASSSSDIATSYRTGTSMAAAHVAGAAAVYLERYPMASPAEVEGAILDSATPGVLSSFGAGSPLGFGSPNLLLYARALGDRTPPTVVLSEPAGGETVSGTVTISADASDNVELRRVYFYAGSTLLGTTSSAPYAVRWDTMGLADGSYSLRAEAVDLGGNSATSEVRTVTVANNIKRWIGVNLLVNGSFETGDTFPWVSDRDTIFRVDYDRQQRTGMYNGACWHPTGSSGECAFVQHVSIPETGIYRVTIYAKADRRGAWVGANLINSGNETQPFAAEVEARSDSWGPDSQYPYMKYEQAIWAQAGDTMKVWGYSPNVYGWLVLDDVSIVKQ